MKRFMGLIALMFSLFLFTAANCCAEDLSDYQYLATKDLVSLVQNAAALIAAKGEAAFHEFKKEGGSFRHGNLYIFILDTQGNMVLHPDPALEGKNEMELKDINGKPIIKNILAAATSYEIGRAHV